MGTTYRYTCRECPYQATVSGSIDRGFDAYTATFWCHDCADLLDIGIGSERTWRERTGGFFKRWIILRDVEVTPVRCDRADDHRLDLWFFEGADSWDTHEPPTLVAHLKPFDRKKGHGRCPRCNGEMVQGGVEMYWD